MEKARLLSLSPEEARQRLFDAPPEVVDLFLTADGAIACRDQCLLMPFRTKKALHFAKQAVDARQKAWDIIYTLWPVTSAGGKWQYSPSTKKITLLD